MFNQIMRSGRDYKIIVTRNYSLQSSRLYGIGEIISGFVMASLSQLVPLPTMVIEVETLAARRALELALELGFDNIVLEGDLEVSHQSPKERHQFFGSVWTYCK
nr:hypothetical protein CFP56_24950 [Quercus suber]